MIRFEMNMIDLCIIVRYPLDEQVFLSSQQELSLLADALDCHIRLREVSEGENRDNLGVTDIGGDS